MDLLRNRFGISDAFVERVPHPELIALRDENKRWLDYDDTEATRSMRAQLGAYNAMLAAADISVDLPVERISAITERSIDLTRKTYRRIFSRSRFDRGGRFYGPWWLNAPKALREHILIDDEETVECDYAGQHVHIAYSLKGLRFVDVHPGIDDPYTISGYEHLERAFRKNALKVALGAATRRSCLLALRQDIRENTDWATQDIDLPAFLQAMERVHEPIRDFFYSDSALILQFHDSRIAKAVIARCMEHEVVALAVHDSFIVQERALTR